MGSKSVGVAACHDSDVAQAAKNAGFEHIFFAKKSDTDGLTKTMMQAIDYAKSDDYDNQKPVSSGNPLIPS